MLKRGILIDGSGILVLALIVGSCSVGLVDYMVAMSVFLGVALLWGLIDFYFWWLPRLSGDAGKRKCPDCAELVQRDANVCRFCGYRITTQEPI